MNHKIIGLLSCLAFTLIFIIIGVVYFQSNSFETGDDSVVILASNYSAADKTAISKLRQKLSNVLVKDYMKSDAYLINFLRANSLDVNAAASMLQTALDWRKKNNVDGILEEDLSAVSKLAPYWIDGYDNYGRPLLTWPFGKWPVATIISQDKKEKLRRLMIQMLEMGSVVTRQRAQETGNDTITQFIILADIEGFGYGSHACFSCLTLYTDFVSTYESYFPASTSNMILINTPGLFEIVLRLIRPIMSEATRKGFRVFGLDKQVWKTSLAKTIHPDQVTSQFGGTKVRY